MKKIKHKSKTREKTISIRKALWKPVFSKNKKNIGTLKEIRIDPLKLTIEGILVEKPLFIENNYIGKNYISGITEKGTILKINPVTEFKGLEVVDNSGKIIGKVKKVNRNKKTNNLKELIVKTGAMKKDLRVPKSKIRNVGKRVMLNVKGGK
jgi:sporulation protein YlmC with PRC-barrel domain